MKLHRVNIFVFICNFINFLGWMYKMNSYVALKSTRKIWCFSRLHSRYKLVRCSNQMKGEP